MRVSCEHVHLADARDGFLTVDAASRSVFSRLGSATSSSLPASSSATASWGYEALPPPAASSMPVSRTPGGRLGSRPDDGSPVVTQVPSSRVNVTTSIDQVPGSAKVKFGLNASVAAATVPLPDIATLSPRTAAPGQDASVHSGTPRSPGSNDAVWVQIPLSGSSDQNDTVPGGQPAAVEMYPSHVPGEPTTAVSPSLEIPVDSPKRLPPAAVD